MCRPSGEWAMPSATISWAGDAVDALARRSGSRRRLGLQQAGEGAQGGGLAGAVGADEGDDLAGSTLKEMPLTASILP